MSEVEREGDEGWIGCPLRWVATRAVDALASLVGSP